MVFCIPTSQKRLTGVIRSPRLTMWLPGRLKNLIWMPNISTATSPRPICTASLSHGCMGLRSSMARSAIARPDTIRTPGVSLNSGAKIATATANPAYMARPPSRGIGLTCAWRPPGSAIHPNRRER